jgi:serine/threonine protein kinase/Tfp pilus assembly protein PilF
MTIPLGQWDLAQKLFEEALRCKPDERANYLERACPNDPGLRRNLLQMVALHEGDPAFLESPVVVQLLSAPLLDPGEMLAGRFRIVRRVGAGGMGEVYEAEDLVDGERPERVALKIVRPGLAPVDDLAPRMRQEIQLAHKVSHPNVCKVHSLYVDRRPDGDRLFLIMDFLDGETLRERLEQTGPLDGREAMSIAQQIAAGVDEAHREGVIHRDLKSSNVMVVRRKDGTTRAVITDFSIAVAEEERFKLGAGTDAYMAPERMEDGGATTRSDVYSFGVVLYEMVTGRLPFDAGTPFSQRRKVPPAPSTIRHGLGRRWDRVILRCLHPIAGRRFTRATDAVAALRPRWRRPVAVAGALLALLLGPSIARPLIDWFLITMATPAVLILPFEVSGGSGLEEGLLNYVGEQLQNTPDIRNKWLVFTPAEARQHGVTTHAKAASAFGARHVIAGTITLAGTSITVAARLLRAGSAVSIRSLTKTCPLDDEVCLQDGLVREFAGVLDPETMVPPQSAIFANDDALQNYLRGMEYLLRDALSYDLAIKFFRQSMANDPSAVLPSIALADAYMVRYRDTGETELLARVRAVLEEALIPYPSLPRLRASFGNLNRLEGRYDLAERELLTSIRADPTNHLFHRMLGNTYSAMGRDEEAVAAYRKVIELQRRYWGGYHDHALLHYNRGRYQEAADLLETLIQWTPDHAQALMTLGAVYVAMGRNADAEVVSRHSCSVSPRRTCYVNLGIALQRQRKTEEAIFAYHEALAFPPTTILFLNLADAYAFLNKDEEAMEYFRRCAASAVQRLRVNVQDSGERAILAYCLAETDDGAGAKREIAQALGHSPNSRNVRRYAVLTYESLGERELALDTLKNATPELLDELEASWGTGDLRRDPRYDAVTQEVRSK